MGAVNSARIETRIEVPVLAGSKAGEKHTSVDMLQPGHVLPIREGVVEITLPPYGSLVLRLT